MFVTNSPVDDYPFYIGFVVEPFVADLVVVDGVADSFL